MAEGATNVYNNIKEQLHLATMDFDTDTFKIILLKTTTFSADDNPAYADYSADEITAAGYSAGGETLTGLTVTQDDTNDRAKWDAADMTWTSLASTTIVGAVIYDDTITATTIPADPCVTHTEIATNSNGGNYTMAFHANGIWLLS